MWIFVIYGYLIYNQNRMNPLASSFTIEFQPVGIRLVCSEPLTLLEAARQAGIQLRADCGGAGLCGKCVIQSQQPLPITSDDRKRLSLQALNEGQHLACAALVSADIQVYIASQTHTNGQVMQTSAVAAACPPDPIIHQQTVTLPAPNLADPLAYFERLRRAANLPSLHADLFCLQQIPKLLQTGTLSFTFIRRADQLLSINPAPRRPLVGLAVDVGSTKLACYLVDLQSGQLLAARGIPNPQIAFGEDIMTRLAHAMRGEPHERQLQEGVIQSINQATHEMCAELQIPYETVADACLVGNTAMHHFFLGLPSLSLATSPFFSVVSSPLYPSAAQLGLNGMPGMGVYVPPIIAGFVGSDHLAFLLACGFGQDDKVRLGIDIGTNTEIALQKGNRILSVSTASGPAFEGAHIRFGMRAATGAIEHVRLQTEGKFELDVIGQQPPVGIGGSGILDALAELRSAGLVNARGRLDKAHPLVVLDESGKPFVKLTAGEPGAKPVTFSQQDIDQVLLAKGAIRAGIEVLLHALKTHPAEIDEVLIAGAFGTFMLPAQAIRIGMLPSIPLERIHAVGNAAGLGARMLLISQTARQQAEALAKRIEYLELTLYPDFELFYARGIQSW